MSLLLALLWQSLFDDATKGLDGRTTRVVNVKHRIKFCQLQHLHQIWTGIAQLEIRVVLSQPHPETDKNANHGRRQEVNILQIDDYSAARRF